MATNGIETEEVGGGQIVQNNLYYSSLRAPDLDPILTDSTKVTANPQFVTNLPDDPGSPGLADISPATDPKAFSRIKALTKLQFTSPAIDKGLAHASVNIDFVGVSRPHGNAFDIGAYEFVPVINKPLPPANLHIF